MKRGQPIVRSVQPDANGMTVLTIRLDCRSQAALEAAVKVLEGAMGAAESVSKSYPSHGDDGRRVYAKFIVPVQAGGVK